MKSNYPGVTYSLFKEGDKYYISIHNPGLQNGLKKRIKRCTQETSERPAKAKAKEILKSLFGSEADPPAPDSKGKINTVSDMLDRYYDTIYLENIKIHSKEKRRKMITNVTGRFKHLKRHIGHINPRTLDMNAVNKYIKLRRKDLKPNGDHYSDGSINFELNLLKAAVKVLGNDLKFSIKANMKDHIKLKQVPRETILSNTQYNNMLRKFAEYDRESWYQSTYAFFLEVLKFTGIRWGQLQLLEYDDINFEKSRLEFPPEKTKHEKEKKHLVYVDRELLIKFKMMLNARDIDHTKCNCSQIKTCKIEKTNFVFVNKHRRCEHFHKDIFYHLWNQYCEDFGYIKFNKFKKGEQESVILPHDIRRTRIIEMIEMGIDRTYIMAQTGHKSHATFDKYNIPQENIMLKMVEGLGAKEKELRKQKVQTVKDVDKDYQNTKESIWTVD
jgi:integrase